MEPIEEEEPLTKMATEISQRTLKVLADKVLLLFSEPNAVPDDSVLQEQLLRPLEGIWHANEVCKVLQSNPTASNFCGKVFKNGEPAIFCK